MIKPLAEKELIKQTQHYRIVAIFEEHALSGGVGSSLAELYVDNNVTDDSCDLALVIIFTSNLDLKNMHASNLV